MKSLKGNIFANYLSQAYVALIGIGMVPFYIKYMGAEAYGLVAFFTLLQVWFQLLDMGLVPTMARQAALLNTGIISAVDFRHLLRSLEGIFLCVALCGGALIILGADFLSTRWLTFKDLPPDEVATSIRMMALICAMRWMGELYRGMITGFERMVWLGGFNIAINTVRFVLIIPFLIWVANSSVQFFGFQLFVAGLELSILFVQAYRLLPSKTSKAAEWSWQPLREVMAFSMAMAFAALAWVAVTQIDKVLLSRILPLAEYGFLNTAVLAAGIVLFLMSPMAGVILPRMTALHGAGNREALLTLYRNATQWTGILVWSSSFVLAFYAPEVLWVWTGNMKLAELAGPVLRLYALGNAVMAIAAFPYYLQFARGKLQLHLLGTGIFALLFLPCMVWAVFEYGPLGAGWVWLGSNLVYLALWVPFVHSRQERGLHSLWLVHDVIPVTVFAFFTVLVSRFLPLPPSRLLMAAQLICVGGVVLLASTLGSSWCRTRAFQFWLQYRGKQ